MIDEKKLIEEMNKTFPDKFLNDKNWFCGKCSFMDLFNELIETFVPKLGEWIPCSEKLPEIGTMVIASSERCVFTDMSYGYAYPDDNKPCFHKWDDEMWQCFKPEIVAWKPLPEPYKGGSYDEKT